MPDAFLRRVMALRDREQFGDDDERKKWLDAQTKPELCEICGDKTANTMERRSSERTRTCRKTECVRAGMKRNRERRAITVLTKPG